jgi:hypothetical protein
MGTRWQLPNYGRLAPPKDPQEQPIRTPRAQVTKISLNRDTYHIQ